MNRILGHPLLPALVVATLLSGCTLDAAGPSATASSAPSAPSAAASAPSPEPGSPPAEASSPALDVSTMPQGAPPRVPYAVAEHPTFGGGDWRLVRPDGRVQPFAPIPGSYVVHADRVVHGFGTEGGYVVEVIDGEGRVVARHEPLCHFGLVVSDREVAGWMEDDGTLVTVGPAGTQARHALDVPGPPCGGMGPAALRGGTLYVSAGSGEARRAATPPWALGVDGTRRALPALSAVTDVSGTGVLLGRLAPRESRCWGVAGPWGYVRWRTCDHELLRFAPDGGHVLGVSGRPWKTHGVAVLDGRGNVSTEWVLTSRQLVAALEWEDAEHVLAVVHDQGAWWLVRLGVDGSAELAAPPVPMDREYAPFRLPQG